MFLSIAGSRELAVSRAVIVMAVIVVTAVMVEKFSDGVKGPGLKTVGRKRKRMFQPVVEPPNKYELGGCSPRPRPFWFDTFTSLTAPLTNFARS
jgi:hypothetical protein